MKIKILLLLSILLVVVSCSENEEIGPVLTLDEEIEQLLNNNNGIINISKNEKSEISFQFGDIQTKKVVLLEIQELLIQYGYENGLIGLTEGESRERTERTERTCRETWKYHPNGGQYLKEPFMSVCVQCYDPYTVDCMVYRTQ